MDSAVERPSIDVEGDWKVQSYLRIVGKDAYTAISSHAAGSLFWHVSRSPLPLLGDGTRSR